MKKIFFLGICVISNILVAYAQPTNIDFNSGNINGWTYTEGGNLDSYLMTMSNPTTSTQYSVMTAGATETNTVPVTMNSPLGGNFIRMGLANTGGNAYKLTQTFRVTSASQGLAISYAVILQDGNHTCNEQPYFNFVIKDSVGNVIGNSNSHYSIYSASCSSGDPSFITSGSFGYKNWINSSFSLSNYVSTNVTVEYMVSGCVVTQGGHIGYAYVDASICNNSFSPNILSVNTNTYNLLQSQNNILVCGTTTADIVAPPGATSYSWTGAGISGLTTQSVSITQTGTYSLVFDNASACSNTTGVTFTVGLNPIVSITASSNNTVCANGAITMTATGGSSYSWTPVVGSGNYFSDEFTVYPTSSTVYTAVATGTNGCSASAQYSITVAPSPSLAITGNTNICLGNSTLLTATGADTYTWTVNGATTNTVLVTPTVTTNYYVTGKITSTGCTQTFVNPVIVNGDVSITPATKKICVGDSILITATGATSYTWSTGANTNTVSLKPTATTNYTLFWTIPACGTYSTVFTVTVNPIPSLTITYPLPICGGQVVSLTTLSGLTSYTWNTGSTNSFANFTPTISTIPYLYTASVAATNSFGCKSSTTNTLTVNPKPILTSNFPVSICSGNTFTLNFGGANTYSLNAVSVSASGSTISPTANTSYTLTGTSLAGCSSSTVNNVTVNTGAPTNILPTTSFTVTPGSTFSLPLGSSADTYTTDAPYTSYDPILKYYVCGPITSTVAQIYNVTGGNSCGTTSGTFQVIAMPTTPLTQSELWSMTSGGGAGGVGAIFKTDGTGSNPILEYSFTDFSDGGSNSDNGLTEASNGMLYGVTIGGGVNLYGTLYQYDPVSGIRTKKRDFVYATGTRPAGQLLKASDGMLYGLATQGGMNDNGVLYQYDPITDVYTKKVDLYGVGNYPYGSLIQASDGKLYGMTSEGGASNLGVLFQYDISSNTLVKKIDLDGTNLGSGSLSTLLQASDGKLYGMTYSGGSNNLGVLFQYNISTNSFVKKIDFDGANKGGNPYGRLIQASNGKLYGLTKNGGNSGFGTMFQYDTGTNGFTKVFDFDGTNKGANPQGSLMQASDGKLYSLTVAGGVNNLGVLFQYDISTSTFTKKVDFDGPSGKGSNPYGTLMQATDGNLYGTTMVGNATGGALFQYNITTSVFTRKADFSGGLNGKNPLGSLFYAPDGKLYGMTHDGGIFNKGVLFQYDPITHVFVKKIDFDGPTNGGNPSGSLMQASDGKLYGLTYNGGANNFGVLFQYDPVANIYTKKFDFSTPLGKNPNGALMQASDGKLYGVTTSGAIFQYDIATSIYSLKGSLSAITNGGTSPNGYLVQANDGKLYGLATNGGAGGWGTIFQYDINTNTLAKKIDFTNTVSSGAYPNGSLVVASDGNLYGMTRLGGNNAVGILFQYNPLTNAFAKKVDFSVNNSQYGDDPYGSLMQASNGKLYGMTSDANNGAKGTLFEYDFNNNIYNFKFRFGVTNGAYPYYSHLVELGIALRTQPINTVQCLGSAVSVPYTIGGTFNSGNVFSAQLSDANGSFISPITIGAYTSTSNGTITATIPTTVSPGTGYRIRVVSSDPVIYGTDNGTNITISASPIPTVTLNSGFVCSGSSYTFSPSGAVTYTYSSGSAIVSPTTITSYTVTGANASGCTNTAVATVSVNPQPVLTVNSGTICSGNSFTIVPGGASTYSFTGSAIVSPTVSTNYTVVGTSTNGCLGTIVSSVIVNALPTSTISSPTSINCISSLASCTVTGGGTYIWTGPGIVSGATSANVMVNLPGIYTVAVTGTNSCVNTNTVAIIANTSAPVFSLTPSTLLSCAGSSVSITANPTGTNSVSYLWSNSAPTQSIVVSPTVTSVYTSTLTDNTNGCYSTEAVTVSVNALQTLTIVGINTVCIGSSTTLTVTNSGIVMFSWSNGSMLPVTNVMPLVNSIYTVNTVDVNGCINSETVSVTVDNTCQDVWPGDSNSDGVADNLDVLELGLHYTQTGAPRASVSNNWQSYFANNWTGTITNGSNLNHSDCNGDGTIDDNDTLAIFNNYGLMHTFKTVQTTTVNPQLSIIPDQPMVVKGNWGTASVYLGDATSQINNINGIAFTVDFDNTLIEPNSIWIEYISSFIDASNLYFRKLDFANSKLFTASTHTVSNNVSGYGKIATLHYQIKSSLSTDEVLNLSLSYANQSSATGSITPLSTGTGTLMAIGASVGLKENNFSGNVLISPNPTNGLLNIRFNSIPQNTKIELYNSIGALVLSETMSDKNNAINVSVLSSGIYFMKVIEGNKVVAVKKLVRE